MAEPNLSIIVPGPCNAKCGFCFWKLPPKADKNYIQDLKKTLDSMPEDFHQISLTGGEPTLSYLLPEILKVIDRQKYNKVVLTTNGTALQKFLLNDKDWENFPNHINISRHHFDDAINAEIFNSKSIIDTDKLQSVIQIAHYNNIDVTLNCVLTKHLTYHDDILGFITYAKNVGADAVCFRKEHGDIEPSMQEEIFDGYPVIGTGQCAVCRTKVQRIDGMNVSWKSFSSEPSKELGELYEAVIHPDGRVTQDWEGKIPMNDPRDAALSKIGDALITIGNELKKLSKSEDKSIVNPEPNPKMRQAPPEKYEACYAAGSCGVTTKVKRSKAKPLYDCEKCKKNKIDTNPEAIVSCGTVAKSYCG